MKQDQLVGTGEEGRHVEESRSPRSKAGGCGTNRNDLWKFHHHCPQTPVNLLLTCFSCLLFGIRPQGHWQGNMEMMSTHRKSGYRKFQITICKHHCAVMDKRKSFNKYQFPFFFFDSGYKLQSLTLGN